MFIDFGKKTRFSHHHLVTVSLKRVELYHLLEMF